MVSVLVGKRGLKVPRWCKQGAKHRSSIVKIHLLFSEVFIEVLPGLSIN